MMLNIITPTHLFELLRDEDWVVVGDDILEYAKPGNNIFHDEFVESDYFNLLECLCFCPFGEVLCGNDYEGFLIGIPYNVA